MQAEQNKATYQFINYLRVLAMALVAWPHLVANMNPTWPVLHFVQWCINRPLHLIQDFGALGVSLFFIISGFLAAENTETGVRYFKKKILRIYFPVLFSMLFFWVFIKLLEFLNYISYWSQFSAKEWLFSATLWNYLKGYPDVVNGVLWYLVPQFIFFAELSVWKTIKSKFGFVQTICILTPVLYVSDWFINIPHSLMTQFHYALIPLIGYAVRIAKLPAQPIKWFGLIYIEIIYGFWKYQQELFESNSYICSVVVALFIFVIFSRNVNSFHENNIVNRLSMISYSFYLTHSLYGCFLITLLSQLNFAWIFSLCIGIIGALIAAYLNYRYIEMPISKLHFIFHK